MAIGGSKDFGFYQPGPELWPEKVVTVTLGHPVQDEAKSREKIAL